MIKKHTYVVGAGILALLVLSTLVAACGAQQGGSSGSGTLDGKALVEERCSVCHGLDRVTSASKSRAEWQANVERMVEQGADLNAAEQEAVIEYLAEAYP
jgi:mono/diheme cytochrome c family protein